MSIQCTIVPVTPYQQNCSIIKCQSTNKAAIVDPGGDVERILEAVEKMGATVEKIILTHAHMDHCAAGDVLRQQVRPLLFPFAVARLCVVVRLGAVHETEQLLRVVAAV